MSYALVPCDYSSAVPPGASVVHGATARSASLVEVDRLCSHQDDGIAVITECTHGVEQYGTGCDMERVKHAPCPHWLASV